MKKRYGIFINCGYKRSGSFVVGRWWSLPWQMGYQFSQKDFSFYSHGSYITTRETVSWKEI